MTTVTSTTTQRGASPYTLLYVGGFGRSGSTLVGRVLGQSDGALCIGETCYLPTRGLVENVQCGCGASFLDCGFWSEVGQEAFGGWSAVDLERLLKADALVSRLRTLPFQWSLRDRSELAAAIDFYVSWLDDLFSAITRVSGASIIVETSKDPWFAGLLNRIPGRDLRIVHLIRDSRAVVYSWTRSKQSPSPIGEQRYMPRFRPVDAALRWTIANSAFHVLALRASAYARINYEEFVTAPRRTLQSLSRLSDTSLSLPTTELTEDSVKLNAHHIFSGNPMRSRTGWLAMRLDDEWRRKLPTAQMTKVTAITWPLLRFYGYPVLHPLRAGTHADRC